MKNVYVVIAIIGFILILGTAGASDLGKISFQTLLIRMAIGTGLFGGGFIGWRTLALKD